MGFEIVDIVIGLEDRFSVHIPDEDASHTATVSDMVKLIYCQQGGELRRDRNYESSPCKSQAIFYELRQIVLGLGRVNRRAIRPSSSLKTIRPQYQTSYKGPGFRVSELINEVCRRFDVEPPRLPILLRVRRSLTYNSTSLHTVADLVHYIERELDAKNNHFTK